MTRQEIEQAVKDGAPLYPLYGRTKFDSLEYVVNNLWRVSINGETGLQAGGNIVNRAPKQRKSSSRTASEKLAAILRP